MCGIVGIVEQDLSRPVAPADLERMVRTLRHRGPDEEGSITLPGVGSACADSPSSIWRAASNRS